MDDEVERLVEKAWGKYEETPPDQRLLIGIAGIPGSGKTTLAEIVTQRLQARASKLDPSAPPTAVALAMDGFHLTRAALSAMPDPEHAHARRGAAFTFDPAKFVALVSTLRAPISATGGEPILAPSFDHALKDPSEGDVVVTSSMRIVVIEGLYLALDAPVWRDARPMFDEVWFVNVDFDVARRRLGDRHVKAGIAKDWEEGNKRAIENDLPNGREIVEHRLPVDEVIESKEDLTWVRE